MENKTCDVCNQYCSACQTIYELNCEKKIFDLYTSKQELLKALEDVLKIMRMALSLPSTNFTTKEIEKYRDATNTYIKNQSVSGINQISKLIQNLQNSYRDTDELDIVQVIADLERLKKLTE